ncbi:glycosyltransferase family 4 protein [Salmonella enterica]|uniref:glycosyltransferase family 4 protein n=1 Tax=Salmonella enterica TaxID=28901 RepID=UPI0008A81B45|nr:glycosyltransferase family 4 protein [Salmonella enterica]AXC65821.1 glycosyltransferase WbuB [Salmonella enterica subsp. diarizonae serovar 59:z10:-]EAW1192565.1 glycosyltransferase WbuB [Salmonella enterica subsp. enterica]EAW9008597.1 glycosyltransferase family 4 protein [Salmonella enterica]EAY5637857.1 glycosyltransferase family 4 protein [Salmonella enterica]EBB1560972.1 glycosyltransferase family 4 protein [Salmonella enterica]
MKLALIIDDYLPHSTRVGAKMFHELALQLNLRGHEITVITPSLNQKDELVIEQLDNIFIWRFRSGVLKDTGKIRRAINETLLSFRAWKAIRREIRHIHFDGIVYYSPSIFWGGLVRKLKKYYRCPAYLVLRDIFPQWAVDADIIKRGSLTERYFNFFEVQSYKQASRIGLMSQKNLEVFSLEHHDFPCEVLRNWAAPEKINQFAKDFYSIRTELGLHDKIIFFYGGNIGHAQDMANLMRLVKNMSDAQNAHFLFVGQGDEVGLINKLAEEWKLKYFTYLPSVNQRKFKMILSEIDIGLFSLSAKHTAHNFPGKLLGYMVESVPILGSVNAGNDLLDIVNSHSAGVIHINGEDEKLLESARLLLNNESLRKQLGKNAYKLLEAEFSVDSAARIIEGCIESEYEKNK